MLSPTSPLIETRKLSARKHRFGVSRNGFTLIELLVTLVIIGLLAGIVTPQIMSYVGTSRTQAARLQIEDLAAGLDLYRLETGDYPTQDQGLEALIKRPLNVPHWSGPYLRKASVPTDPWGRPYQYRIPGEHGVFDLYSLGTNGTQGGTGEDQDVASWE